MSHAFELAVLAHGAVHAVCGAVAAGEEHAGRVLAGVVARMDALGSADKHVQVVDESRPSVVAGLKDTITVDLGDTITIDLGDTITVDLGDTITVDLGDTINANLRDTITVELTASMQTHLNTWSSHSNASITASIDNHLLDNAQSTRTHIDGLRDRLDLVKMAVDGLHTQEDNMAADTATVGQRMEVLEKKVDNLTVDMGGLTETIKQQEMVLARSTHTSLLPPSPPSSASPSCGHSHGDG
ncbi:hypothetical protein P153DRAFT_361758 [Dothidotthia symphoricarpi CBS 119687]|uniref:t-SNARE coiled-coil homology domain-containing protein n=1 Tax=Dothidotthia symphoricarpi CBS 119687 TaxID=1392245 RepID=A0A6A5ZVM6_9PLEO|nr:uncharacterized protein P153DRAFT_361758 [Dothidotthia symphoricarpi CBS 119687]KAF2123782.1 hypothetical protein P153DRAFT_361758 [Dothidotthia symphoricarpi CBS 119687]